MGSLPEGTMCYYCDDNPAGYIPDRCSGPVCGPCLDLMISQRWLEVVKKMWRRLWPASYAKFATVNRAGHEQLLAFLNHDDIALEQILECLDS